MVTQEDSMSIDGRQAIKNMVESEMYLVAQPQQVPWPMLPRGVKKLKAIQRLNSSQVASGVARTLLDQGFIEATSCRTFVVSKVGHRFYEQNIKIDSQLVSLRREG